MRSVDLDRLTIASLARALVARQLSPIEVTEACLARIDRLDPRLNSFITPTAERALADARQAEAEILRGEYRGPLHGVPLALKDIFATRGIRTTCGARVLRDWVPARDATVVQRLSDAGAVLLGKLNMSEFAYGAVHPDYPLPRNPWCQDRFTGGSSSGSGGAVAAGLCFGSLGTDTGGSVRQPAAYCGIVGLKPSYGVVSRAGVVPLSWSLDHVGPMARTAEDAGLLLDAIAGLDPTDASSIRLPRARPDTLDVLTPDVRKSRVGLVADSLRDPTAPEVITCVREAVRVLEPLVARIEEVTLPHADAVAAAWSAICLPEASAYHGQTLRERPEDFGEDVRGRLQAGLAVPAVQYLKAQQVRGVIANEYTTLFARVDLLVLPTMLTTAPTIESTRTGLWDGFRDRGRFTAGFNLIGLPAVSVPCGWTPSGLPVGLQIVGPRLSDWTVLGAAHAYQQASRWNGRRTPPLE